MYVNECYHLPCLLIDACLILPGREKDRGVMEF